MFYMTFVVRFLLQCINTNVTCYCNNTVSVTLEKSLEFPPEIHNCFRMFWSPQTAVFNYLLPACCLLYVLKARRNVDLEKRTATAQKMTEIGPMITIPLSVRVSVRCKTLHWKFWKFANFCLEREILAYKWDCFLKHRLDLVSAAKICTNVYFQWSFVDPQYSIAQMYSFHNNVSMLPRRSLFSFS